MTYFGGCPLSEHDTDEDASNHRIVKGTWREATCKERDAAFESADPKTWSTLSDPDGRFGEKLMFTEWGSRDGNTPVAADVKYIEEGKPCRHMVYDVAP